MDIKSYSYTLRTDRGHWLAQIVLTDDGFFGAVTDYGNFSYAWRAFGDNFKVFLSELNMSYFAIKMASGLSYSLGGSKKVDKACAIFAEEILPPLQAILKEEIKKGATNGR
ncbi:MAG: hypothetical protein V1701_02810 [Planctomycetota bacterium]